MKRMLVLLALTLTACTSEETKVEDAVRSVLRDPASAQFESVAVRGAGAERVACGMVNAKTPMGGFGGPQAFMIRGDQLWLGSDSTSAAVQLCCSVHLMPEAENDPRALEACEPRLPEPVTIYH